MSNNGKAEYRAEIDSEVYELVTQAAKGEGFPSAEALFENCVNDLLKGKNAIKLDTGV